MKNGKQKNNILHISRTMDIGGAERIVYQLATDLKDEFDQVHVASTGGLWEEKLAENGIQHHRILDVDSKHPATVLKILSSLSKIIKEKEITLVHTHHRMAAFYVRLLQLRHPNLIHVYTAHNVFKDKLPLYKFALGKAHAIAVGEAVNENLKADVGIKETTVIYNGVLMKESQDTVTEIAQTPGVKIGCIARLSEQKGLSYLIQAMSLVTNPSVSLFLVGDGELKNDLINQTKELGLEERIHFLGYRSDVVECINSFDFCVLPSIFEGFGLVAIEAFMNGKTMIATDIPGVNEVVNSENGLLVPAEDPQALAQAIKKLAENPEERASLAAQAKRDYDNKFSYPIFLNNYRNFYQSMKKGSK